MTLYLCALIWLMVGAGYALRYYADFVIPLWLVVLMTIGMIGFALLLIDLGLWLVKGGRQPYYASLVLLSASIIAVIFDDVGWVDVIATLPPLATVIYFLKFKQELGG